MPDTKITALTALTAADPANDVLPIVDVSDTTMAASGTTKKISINNILGASGTATLASATISGDLTVDTNTLKVVSSLDFVAIGATAQSFGEKFRINGNYTVMNDGAFTGFLGKASAIGASGSTTDFGIRSDNALVFLTNGATEQMRLNSTGLGVGRSPSYKLDVAGVGNFDQLRVAAANATKMDLVNTTSGLTYSLFSANTAANGFNGFAIFNGTDYDLRIVSGNVGIGVSTFGTSAARVLSIGTGTEPTTGPAGTVQFFSSTRSANNTIPAIFCEGSGVTNAAITNTTVTNKIAIKVNGTIYYLLATTSAA